MIGTNAVLDWKNMAQQTNITRGQPSVEQLAGDAQPNVGGAMSQQPAQVAIGPDAQAAVLHDEPIAHPCYPGLMRVALGQLHQFLAGTLPAVTGTLVGRNEGLVRPDCWTDADAVKTMEVADKILARLRRRLLTARRFASRQRKIVSTRFCSLVPPVRSSPFHRCGPDLVLRFLC